MYKSLNREKGLSSLAALLIALTITSAFVIYYSQYVQHQRMNQTAEKFYERLLYYRDSIHAYAADRYQAGWGVNTQSIFPTRFSDLEGVYIPTCSVSDNEKGFCERYNQTSLGLIPDSNYSVVPVPNAASPTHYRAEIVINLPDKTDNNFKFERAAVLQYASQMPNVVYNDASNTLTLRVDRPDKAFAYDSLVKRSGDDSTLLGDWDVGGNFAITNVKDITLRNSDGSQKGVSSRLTDIYTVSHGTWIQKPKCPTGKNIVPSFSITEVLTDDNHTLTGMQRAYKLNENSTHIQVGLDVGAKRNLNGANVALHAGLVTVTLQCK
ncbi:hypothetical protein [Vibrio cholerae]|uniref:hypothetical protein n=1 Tax=Vibrio cholerae TaxID=666 RepID=UPI0005B31E8A|nr:hypothetical protein [Vibrio cholerae]